MKFKDNERKSRIYRLSGAYYRIVRVGQVNLKLSDDVCVRVSIFLPGDSCNDKMPYVQKNLRFESRLQILDAPIHAQWGDVAINEEGRFRVKSKEFSGQKWKELFRLAEELADSEIMKLEQAIAARASALEAAEEE